MQQTRRLKGILYAVVSSSTFGLAPLFTLTLLHRGLSPLEVLTYRWGVAALALGTVLLCTAPQKLRVAPRDLAVVFALALLRAACSFGLVVAYGSIASGTASTLHFLYPLVVTLIMAFVFRERTPWPVYAAAGASLAGIVLLSGEGSASGIIAALTTVFTYGGYIVGIRKTRAARIDSSAVTFYVMTFGAALFFAGGQCASGVRPIDTPGLWAVVLALALLPTLISNLTLVRAINRIGPTFTSILGSLEPLTAVVIGVVHFGEAFTPRTAAGIALVLASVTTVILQQARNG